MYSLLPAVVAVLFLGYGVYVLRLQDLNRISGSFFLLCFTTFCWQFTWAVLFQIENPLIASLLVKTGYFFILFLPTTLYHFLVEMTGKPEERKRVYLSYALSAGLAVTLMFTDWFIQGYYDYFFGYYPKAGWLHPVHVIQTTVVVLRGLYISWKASLQALPRQRIRLRYCVTSLLIYLFAAVDYLCNYGLEFYPPGVFFVAISLGLLAIASARYQLLDVSLVMGKGVARLLAIALITLGAALGALFLHGAPGGLALETRYLLGFIGLIVLCELYQPLRETLQDISAKVVVRGRPGYDLVEVSRSINLSISHCLSLDRFARELADILASRAHFFPVKMYARTDAGAAPRGEEARFELVQNKNIHGSTLDARHPLVEEFARDASLIRYDSEAGAAARAFLQDQDAVCAVAGKSKAGTQLIVLLGRHDGYASYTGQDLDLIESLPAQMTLAIERTEAHVQICDALEKAQKTASLLALMNEYQHELKTPVSIMHMYAQAEADLDSLRTEVLTQSERALQLMEQMLRVLEEKRIPQQHLINLNHVVENALFLLPVKENPLVLDLAPNLPEIIGDREDLLILVINLVKNAVEASAPGKLNPIGIASRVYADGVRVELKVTDQGVGMSQEALRLLRTPLATTKRKGTGIGFKVILRIVREHGGEISMQSEPDKGTWISVVFPIAQKSVAKNSE